MEGLTISRELVHKAIRRSQHCQRNWDLSKAFPEEDIELLSAAVGECPSKQNVAYYNVHFITNRDLIEKIHAQTDGFVVNYENGKSTTNPQVLANLLVVFEEKQVELKDAKDVVRNEQTYMMAKNDPTTAEHRKTSFERDRDMAVGIAAGYLNLTSSLIGYSTGCCLCFNPDGVREILGLNGKPLLLMGIGFRDANRSRLEHHQNSDFMFPTKNKQAIEIKRLA